MPVVFCSAASILNKIPILGQRGCHEKSSPFYIQVSGLVLLLEENAAQIFSCCFMPIIIN